MNSPTKDLKLKDIARIAGVSPAAVSLVYNGKPGVGDAKREEILSILRQNGYAPANSNARQQRNILFLKFIRHSLLVDGNPGFMTRILDSAERECRRKGFNLLVSTATPESIDMMLEQMKFNYPEGILLLGTEMTDDDFWKFYNIECPLVVVDNPVDSHPFGSITMDNRSAIYESVRYLKECGHPGIGFLRNELPSSNCLCRERSFADAVASVGYVPEDCPMFPVQPTSTGSYMSVKRYLDANVSFPSALIANNDSIALGAMKAFKEYNIRIPDDISIIGFDGIQFSEIAEPPLTTTIVPCGEIGTLAVQMICRYLEAPETEPYKILVTARLCRRGSVRPYVEMAGNSIGNMAM